MQLSLVLHCYQTFAVDLFWNRSVVNLVSKLSNDQLVLDENLIEICTKPSTDPLFASFISGETVLGQFQLPSAFPVDNITLYLSMLVSNSLQNFQQVQTNISRAKAIKFQRGKYLFTSIVNKITELEPVVLREPNNTPAIIGIVVGVVVLILIIVFVVYKVTRKYDSEPKQDYSLRSVKGSESRNQVITDSTLILQNSQLISGRNPAQ
ncbi:Hypothetical_protein [Hexamita inflata]|uniref:Hypothetical_protein n=1 Tax=Hexamita inflata TaxID=28002 RepID=A0AA86Q8F0_9EUKA|nr:Hypothetical protein HINF_LOCUS40151 [Hexamita inflata]